MRPDRLAAYALALMVCMGTASAQLRDADPDWKESTVPPPPTFDAARVVLLDMPRHMSVRLGVDPATIRISDDGIVRYVMVALSPGGTMNASYEGIRCLTAEVKVYARYTSSQVWNAVANPQWQPLRDNQPSPHALTFARQGACDGRSAAASSVNVIVEKLRTVERITQHK